MYSIMCVYMHHICIYNVYVYIFVVNFPPVFFVLFFYHFWGVLCFISNVHIHITTRHNARNTCFVLWEYQIKLQTI